MNDYLEIFEKFKDIKDMTDYIDEVRKLRYFYGTGQVQEMQIHIGSLTKKYAIETLLWNIVNNEAPVTYEQSYINAENFMCAQGAKLVTDKVHDFKKRLSQEEITFIESMIKPME